MDSIAKTAYVKYMKEAFVEKLSDVIGAAQETQPGEFPAELEEKTMILDWHFSSVLEAVSSDPEDPK